MLEKKTDHSRCKEKNDLLNNREKIVLIMPQVLKPVLISLVEFFYSKESIIGLLGNKTFVLQLGINDQFGRKQNICYIQTRINDQFW